MLKKILFVVLPFGLMGAVASADDGLFAELENVDAGAIVELDTVDLDIDEVSFEAEDFDSLVENDEQLAEELCGWFGGYGYGFGYGCYNYCRPFVSYYSCYRPIYRSCYFPIYRHYCWW